MGYRELGQDAAYLSTLAISSRWWHGWWAGEVLAFGWQRWPALRSYVGHDPSSNVTSSLGMLVIHVVASLAIILLTGVASSENVVGAAQCALVVFHDGCLLGRRLHGFLGCPSDREFDDLVVGVTTIPGERRWWYLWWCRDSFLSMFLRILLLLRQYPVGHGPRHT